MFVLFLCVHVCVFAGCTQQSHFYAQCSRWTRHAGYRPTRLLTTHGSRYGHRREFCDSGLLEAFEDVHWSAWIPSALIRNQHWLHNVAGASQCCYAFWQLCLATDDNQHKFYVPMLFRPDINNPTQVRGQDNWTLAQTPVVLGSDESKSSLTGYEGSDCICHMQHHHCPVSVAHYM